MFVKSQELIYIYIFLQTGIQGFHAKIKNSLPNGVYSGSMLWVTDYSWEILDSVCEDAINTCPILRIKSTPSLQFHLILSKKEDPASLKPKLLMVCQLLSHRHQDPWQYPIRPYQNLWCCVYPDGFGPILIRISGRASVFYPQASPKMPKKCPKTYFLRSLHGTYIIYTVNRII